MMVAGGIAHRRGREEAEQEEAQGDQGYQEAPPPAPPPPAPSAADATGELERLASMHQSGALSDEEFAAAKQKVLGA
jgi:multidrug resistance efflux pump